MKRDLRQFAKQTNFQLIVGGLLILFIIGGGLIYFIYGPSSAIFGIFCLGIGLIPIALIFLFFVLVDWILKNARKE